MTLPLKIIYDNGGNPSGLGEFVVGTDSIPATLLAASALSSLSDVSASLLPTSNEVLAWDGTIWTASTVIIPAGGAGSLSALSDTSSTFVDIKDGQVVRWNSIDQVWIPSGVVVVSGTAPEPHDGRLWLDTVGGLSGVSDSRPTETKTVSFTVAQAMSFVAMDCTASSVSGTLPDASAVRGKQYDFQKIDATANLAVLDGNGFKIMYGSLAAGVDNISLEGLFDDVTLLAHDSKWWII